MGSPKYENGQVVFYRPMGGTISPEPHCTVKPLTPLQDASTETTESTGIITDILMEPGLQANMSVNASAAQPRYEVSRLRPRIHMQRTDT